MPYVHANGINIYYEEHGTGEPLVLIMGFTVSSVGWHWNIPDFAKQFRVIAFDNRGVGQSDKPDVPYSMAMFADDTAGVLAGLGIDKAHIFGISMGGMIAQEFALRYPQRVKTLTLGCTNCGGSQTVLSKDPDVVSMLTNIASVDVQQAALTMTKVAVTPWFMQKRMDVLLELNRLSAQPSNSATWDGMPDARDPRTRHLRPASAAHHAHARDYWKRRWACASREFRDSGSAHSER